MNYLEIILQAFLDENNREFLDKYFYREYKKAEKEHFEADEFFNGCIKVIEKWERYLQQKVDRRFEELCKMLEAAKDGTLKYDSLEGKSYEQKIQESIIYCEKELKDIRPDGIGSVSYYIHLHSLTNGRISYNMPYSEALSIKRAILEAYQKTVKKEITDIIGTIETPVNVEKIRTQKFKFLEKEVEITNKIARTPTPDQKRFLKAFVKNLTDGHKITYAIETACEISKYSNKHGYNLYKEVREGSLKYEPLSEILNERKQLNNNDVID